jgi:4-amino-4-deoxy-L-arabinose transferase-like glycosyltransferase
MKLIQMQPVKAANLVYASREMIESADPAAVAVIENDMAEALVTLMVQGFLYGNGAGNTPLGLANMVGLAKLESGATGDALTRAFGRQLKSKVPQKYVSNNFKFLGNRNEFWDLANAIVTAAPDGSAMGSDDMLIKNALGEDYVSSGLVKADKAKGAGHDLSDMFYGAWEKFMVATWWGGLRIDSTNVGGDAFANDMIGFRAVLPVACAARDIGAFAHAPYVKTTLS